MPGIGRYAIWTAMLLCTGCQSRTPTDPHEPFLAKNARERGEVRSANLGTCPYGHTTLKDVPIIYGLLIDETGGTQTRAAIDRYEMWPGGCTVTSRSPRIRVTCTTCGFGYDSDLCSWSRSSDDRESFRDEFSELARSFPAPVAAGVQVKYEQTLEAGKLTREGMTYTNAAPLAKVANEIADWYARKGIEVKYVQRPVETTDGQRKTICEWESTTADVMLQHFEDDQTNLVMLWVRHASANP